MSESSAADRVAASVNKVSVGRVYDYLLGGVHNYAVDQAFAEEQLKIIPDARNFALSNRAFLGRAVRYAIDQGIRQFVDIGSGLPTQGNVHEVADEAAPGQSRVVYIDNEPIAHAHAEILLDRTADPSRHRAIDADFFDRDVMWQRVLDTGLIDPDKPVALLVVALLHFMPPETDPGAVLDYYKRQLAPGSLLALSHIHVEPDDLEMLEASKKVSTAYKERTNSPAGPRSRPDIEAFFSGLELVEPGLVWVPQWRPDGKDPFDQEPKRARGLAGVGRKV
ncbi:SAM-dependent methyltransferase [Amycolatopsis suaedae]|uniref:Polyketide biosynthesis methyltransferase n=1 Tax=Amycolatopsis suaedae TaxID=2510978 RepID=A0A4Q7J9K0_9PSEU|nr:SAM-dependent methyltransferase [Amycolatopsis suaedae]RZQ63897.1 polyketide biosynthesis methyltransferase [Amycolatopsis suaedae]